MKSKLLLIITFIGFFVVGLGSMTVLMGAEEKQNVFKKIGLT